MTRSKSTDGSDSVVESSSSGGSGSGGSADVDLSNHPEYADVELPTIPPTEYNYVQRRGELLSMIEAAGVPAAVGQGQAADRYGVSQQQISKDMRILKAYLAERIGDRDDRAALVASVAERAIRDLLDDGKPRKAWQTAREYDSHCESRSDVDELYRLAEEATSDDY